MKRIINIFILIAVIVFSYLAVSTNFELDCIFKKITGICCPGCGLTRSFRCILNLDFSGAIYYNILGIPLFIGIVLGIIMIIRDIIFDSNKTILLFKKICSKYYLLIILILIITMIINNINGI